MDLVTIWNIMCDTTPSSIPLDNNTSFDYNFNLEPLRTLRTEWTRKLSYAKRGSRLR